MAYKAGKHNAFERGFKKLDPQHKPSVADECERIQADPSIGDNMKGNFKKLDIKKKSVKDINPEIRILYKIYNCTDKNEKTLLCSEEVRHDDIEQLQSCNGLVDFIICGPREMFNNFYKLPLDKLKKYL